LYNANEGKIPEVSGSPGNDGCQGGTNKSFHHIALSLRGWRFVNKHPVNFSVACGHEKLYILFIDKADESAMFL
jgi:hypothetical protein